MASSRIFLLTGFAPFGGERVNPSWEVARSLDGEDVGPLLIKAVRVPVGCAKAVHRINAAIVRYRPRAILGLGEAGGRTAISLEQLAINLADERHGLRTKGNPGIAQVIEGGPDAYFTRMPLPQILHDLDHERIPAAVSLSAGAYACNALMYASLHLMRRRPRVPVGFIHLPYEERQALRHRSAASMPLKTMQRAVRVAIEAIVASL
jgi:pyroglutamyl-peptidase